MTMASRSFLFFSAEHAMLARLSLSRPGKHYLAVAIAGLLGTCLAWYLYGGEIPPRSIDWLLSEGDTFQHYIGWHFFRREDWGWPLGELSTLASDIGTSIVYTDSIPILALPLKLFHAWLPDPFQYLGLALLINLTLNAAVACHLLLRCALPWLAAVLGAVLFAALPAVTLRGLGAHGHEALTAHWLILLAMTLFLFRPQATNGNATRWLALLGAAVMIHFYLFFMVGVLWAVWWARAGWHAERRGGWQAWLAMGVLTPLIILVLMWAVGYFQLGHQTLVSGGYGYYSAELLTFFNPLSDAWMFNVGLESLSSIWPGWHSPISGQYEGQSYVGLGVVLLWLVALYGLIRAGMLANLHALPGSAKWLLGLSIGLFVFALSDQVVIGSQVFDLHYQDLIGPLAYYLRSSGRLVWPLMYVLLLGSLVWLARRMSPLRLCLLLVLAIAVQRADLRPWFAFVRDTVHARVTNETQSYPVLEATHLQPLWQGSHRLIALPAHDLGALKPYLWLAAEHDMSINVAYAARATQEVVNDVNRPYRNALENGQLEDGAVYLLTDDTWPTRVCSIDGVRCEQLDDGVTLAWRAVPTTEPDSPDAHDD